MVNEQKVGKASGQKVGKPDANLSKSLKRLARVTGLEPATFGVTGRLVAQQFHRSSRLNAAQYKRQFGQKLGRAA